MNVFGGANALQGGPESPPCAFEEVVRINFVMDDENVQGTENSWPAFSTLSMTHIENGSLV